jgi:hypothetical protein
VAVLDTTKQPTPHREERPDAEREHQRRPEKGAERLRVALEERQHDGLRRDLDRPGLPDGARKRRRPGPERQGDGVFGLGGQGDGHRGRRPRGEAAGAGHGQWRGLSGECHPHAELARRRVTCVGHREQQRLAFDARRTELEFRRPHVHAHGGGDARALRGHDLEGERDVRRPGGVAREAGAHLGALAHVHAHLRCVREQRQARGQGTGGLDAHDVLRRADRHDAQHDGAG